MNRKRLALLLCCCVPLFCSCSFITLERQIYPICMSLDVTEDGRFQIGVQAPRASGNDDASYDIITASGKTPQDTLRVLSASTPYPLNFSQIRLCMISYRLASTTALRPLLRVLLELPSMRPTAYISIALGSALDVLQNQQPDFGMRLSTHLSLLLDRTRQERLLPDSTLANCVRELSDGRSDFLIGVCAVNPSLIKEEETAKKESPGGGSSSESSPAFAIGEPWSDELLPENVLAGMLAHTSPNPVEYLGSAAISSGRVSGILTADETQLTLRLLSEAKLKVAREGEQIQLQIWLDGENDLANDQERIRTLMEKLKTLHSDPLTFGRICSMGFLTDREWQAFRFQHKYPAAPLYIGME